MNKKFLLAIATAAGIAAATTSLAAPLPAGTLLKITPMSGSPFIGPITGCTSGSCLGIMVFQGVYGWYPLAPGTDGGIVIGKGQLSGGQETDPLSTRDGELTAMFSFGDSSSTFFTAPSDAGNVFDDQSCTGSGCGSNTTPRKTDLAVWNAARGGQIIPLGSASGCDPILFDSCTPDQAAGIFVKSWTIDPVARTWSLEYGQVMKNVFTNFPIELVLRGTTAGHVNLSPVANDVQAEGTAGVELTWKPVVSDADGPKPLTCFIGTPPAAGVATVAADCSGGTYTSGIKFSGIDSFTYGANDGLVNSNLATMTAAISGSSSAVCTQTYPVKQVTYNSKSKLTMVVTGNISKTTNREVRICPTTKLEYNATSTVYPVTCYINNAVVLPKGSVTVGSELKCNVKPYAGDQYSVRIKSAI